MPNDKDFSVEDEAYLHAVAAEPKMTTDELVGDDGNPTLDPSTAQGSLANALDEALSADTDLEHTTITRDRNDGLDAHLTDPTDDFRDETKGEMEGTTDTPQNLLQPIESNKVNEGLKPMIQQDAATNAKESLAYALDSITMDGAEEIEKKPPKGKDPVPDYSDYSEENASHIDYKAPNIPSSLGGEDDKPDANGLVYVSATFTVDPEKYISNNYRPSNTAQAPDAQDVLKKASAAMRSQEQQQADGGVEAQANPEEEEALSDLGTPEAKESAMQPNEPTEQQEEQAAKDADKEQQKEIDAEEEEERKAVIPKPNEKADKPTQDEAPDKVVLDYATFIDGSSFMCFDEISDIDYTKIAMDSGPKKPVTRANCQTTFAQCRAKNPLFCRFHGPKLLEADIKTAIKATVGNGCLVSVTKDTNAKNKFTFRLTVGCPPSKKMMVEKMVHMYLTQNPGITSATEDWNLAGKHKQTLEFDMDILRADKPPEKNDLKGKKSVIQTKKDKAAGKVQGVVGETAPALEKKAAKGEKWQTVDEAVESEWADVVDKTVNNSLLGNNEEFLEAFKNIANDFDAAHDKGDAQGLKKALDALKAEIDKYDENGEKKEGADGGEAEAQPTEAQPTEEKPTEPAQPAEQPTQPTEAPQPAQPSKETEYKKPANFKGGAKLADTPQDEGGEKPQGESSGNGIDKALHSHIDELTSPDNKDATFEDMGKAFDALQKEYIALGGSNLLNAFDYSVDHKLDPSGAQAISAFYAAKHSKDVEGLKKSIQLLKKGVEAYAEDDEGDGEGDAAKPKDDAEGFTPPDPNEDPNFYEAWNDAYEPELTDDFEKAKASVPEGIGNAQIDPLISDFEKAMKNYDYKSAKKAIEGLKALANGDNGGGSPSDTTPADKGDSVKLPPISRPTKPTAQKQGGGDSSQAPSKPQTPKDPKVADLMSKVDELSAKAKELGIDGDEAVANHKKNCAYFIQEIGYSEQEIKTFNDKLQEVDGKDDSGTANELAKTMFTAALQSAKDGLESKIMSLENFTQQFADYIDSYQKESMDKAKLSAADSVESSIKNLSAYIFGGKRPPEGVDSVGDYIDYQYDAMQTAAKDGGLSIDEVHKMEDTYHVGDAMAATKAASKKMDDLIEEFKDKMDSPPTQSEDYGSYQAEIEQMNKSIKAASVELMAAHDAFKTAIEKCNYEAAEAKKLAESKKKLQGGDGKKPIGPFDFNAWQGQQQGTQGGSPSTEQPKQEAQATPSKPKQDWEIVDDITTAVDTAMHGKANDIEFYTGGGLKELSAKYLGTEGVADIMHEMSAALKPLGYEAWVDADSDTEYNIKINKIKGNGEADQKQSESQAPQKKQLSDDEKKAKIAAMSPKQKLEAAVKIFKKKLAADPNNAEAKAKLAKYEAMLSKLGK